jgi:periplasmic protein TonB
MPLHQHNPETVETLSSTNYIEKSILYFLAFSLLLHGLLFAVIVYLPREKKAARPEPIMVELQDLPPSRVTPAEEKKETRRAAEERRRVARETAPRGEREKDRIAALPKRAVPHAAQPQRDGGEMVPRLPEKEMAPAKESPPGESLLKPKEQGLPDISKLFPTAEKMARLEDGYRKKYKDIEQGDTRLIDTDDDVLASFAYRFKSAVQERWNTLARAAGFRELGVAVLLITIKRDGMVEDIKLLESTGNKVLDDVAIKTVRTAGFVGPLPKKWPHNQVHFLYIYHVHD